MAPASSMGSLPPLGTSQILLHTRAAREISAKHKWANHLAVGNPPSSSSHGLGGATLGKELGLSSNLGPFPGASGAAEDLVPDPGSALFQLPTTPRSPGPPGSWAVGGTCISTRLAPRRGGDGDCLPASFPISACRSLPVQDPGSKEGWVPQGLHLPSSPLCELRAPPDGARPPGRPESSLSRQPWSRTCSPGLLWSQLIRPALIN